MAEILFLAHRVPFPPDRGDKIRSYHLLAAMAELARVHLVAFVEDESELAHAAALRRFVGGALHLIPRRRTKAAAAVDALMHRRPLSLACFDDPELRARVKEVIASERLDAVFAFSGQMAQHVPADLGGARFVMDFVDMDSAKFTAYADRANPIMRRVFAREAALLARFERRTALRAEVSSFVSEAEARLFRSATGLGPERVIALENGIDLERFSPDASFERLPRQQGPLIVFTGQMDYAPNVEAVTRFARRVLPEVRNARPSAGFAIVGRAPTDDVRRLGELPGVIVTGEVADTRSWLAAADIVVAPLLLARGVQNKVLEAMAMARAVVASPDAAEGIDATPGRDLIVSPVDAQAPVIAALLGDADERRAIGSRARARMIARYDWHARLAGLPALLGLAREPELA